MRKFTMIMLMAALMVSMFAAAAMAEQIKFTNDVTGYVYYNSTSVQEKIYNEGALPRLHSSQKFTPEGVTNYPYEIYLPNEQAPGSYRIHTNYTNDTDACASCHATHTAVGAALLQWYTTYDTCMACHDGTVSTTYNVQDGVIGAGWEPGRLTFGGLFGMGNEQFLSNHNVTGAVEIAAAPGGSTKANPLTTNGGKDIIQWKSTFGCESCHSPHGQGGNARILHPDANGVATQNRAAYYEYSVSANAVSTNKLFLVGYPYKIEVKETSGGSAINATYYSISNSTGNTTITFKTDVGYSIPTHVYVVGTPSLKVQMEISDYLTNQEFVVHKSGMNEFCGACHTDYDTTAVSVAALAVGQEKNKSGQKANGTFSKAMRHAVGIAYDEQYVSAPVKGIGTGTNDYMKLEARTAGVRGSGQVITCLTCHVAHGVSKDYWSRAVVGYTYNLPGGGTDTVLPKYSNIFGSWNDNKLAEISGSSALKRLPNMGTCEACHEKGNAADGYLALTGQTNAYTKPEAGSVRLYTYLYNQVGGGYLFTSTSSQADVEEKCKNCHPNQVDNFYKSASNHKTLANRCESCHGEMGNHIKYPSSSNNVIKPSTKTITNQISGCTAGDCHTIPGTQFANTNMKRSGVISCITCHSMMNGNEYKHQLIQPKGALCANCHNAVKTNSAHSFSPTP